MGSDTKMLWGRRPDAIPDILAGMGRNVERSGALLAGLVRGDDPAAVRGALVGLRTAQRDCQKRLLEALAGTLVTPLDGQDIFTLALGLGRLVNEVTRAATRLNPSVPAGPALVELVSCVEESLKETNLAVGCLVRRDRRRAALAGTRVGEVQDRAGRLGARSGGEDVFIAFAAIVDTCAEVVQTVHWVILHNA